MKQRWIGFFAFPVCKILVLRRKPRCSFLARKSRAHVHTHAYCGLVVSPSPGVRGCVAVDDQDSDRDNEDESGVNA